MGTFQGRKAKSVLEYKDVEAIVISHIEELAEEQLRAWQLLVHSCFAHGELTVSFLIFSDTAGA
jgi:hypothetical protein